MRGYYGIALYEPKFEENLGTVIRSCMNFRADFICTIGNRYSKQASDTTDATKHIPLFHFKDTQDFIEHIPKDCELVSIEVDGKEQLESMNHPQRAIYILGGEDRTLPEEIQGLGRSARLDTNYCLNMAVTASVVMYDRHLKSIPSRTKSMRADEALNKK